jgi:hypothetical protein
MIERPLINGAGSRVKKKMGEPMSPIEEDISKCKSVAL